MTLVEDILEHHGVKGMKWGVRKTDEAGGKNEPKLVLTHKFKSGDSVSIYEKPTSGLARVISKMSPKYAADVEKFKMFSFKDKDGKSVGEGSFNRTSKDELYLNWVGVKTKYRGKGYASAAMKGVVQYAQNEGIKKLTLEVPGNAPDARHIYEKLGFKVSGKMMGTKNDYWGGLYPMEMKVGSVKHADIVDDQWETDFANEFESLLVENFGDSKEEVKHVDTVEQFLNHYGVKGMHWGKKKGPASSDSAAATSTRTAAKKSGLRTVSNTDLQTAIKRMQLEQDFKRLSVNEKSPVTRWLSSTLLEVGKREVQQRVAKKVATTVIKKAVTGGTG